MNVTKTGENTGNLFNLSSAALHIIAMVSMLIDHTMKTVVEYDGWIFILGRLAFPVFAFMVAEGCFYTRNARKYGLRLFLFALISEIPYDLMKSGIPFDPYDQNVIWTFFIAFLCLLVFKAARATEKKGIYIPSAIAVSLAGFIAATLLASDYGGMGVMMVLIFYFFRERKWWMMMLQILLLAAINILFLGGFGYGVTFYLSGSLIELPLQGFALLAIIPIWMYHGRQGYHSKPFQYFCYAFYPVHMLVLFLISHVI